jgi:carboxyl-terminal processing protease
MIRLFIRAGCCAVVALLSAAPARGQDGAITQALATATFDTAWARINRTYYDTTFLSRRWTTLRDSLRPFAARAKTNAELRVVLQALISSVGVSHFGLIPKELSPALDEVPATRDASREPGTIGASLRLAGDRILVWKVDTGGPAWLAGVRPGLTVGSINSTNLSSTMPPLAKIENESVRRQATLTAVMRANAMLAGSIGDTVTLGLSSYDEMWTTRVVRGPMRGQMLRFGNLPPLNSVVDVSERTVAGPNGPRRIGVIAFTVWLPLMAKDLDRAFDRLRGADAIIIDLRGNPGGVAGMVSGIAGHMLDSTYLIGTMVQRTQTLKLTANPRRVSSDSPPVPVRPYAGPVAILVDQLTGSTSEFFAAGLQGLGRAHIVGETSAGAALPAVMDRLPNDDVMMHVVADLTDSKGRRVEGVGVVPDEVVPLKAAALAAGHDDALDAALRWAAKQPRTNK